MSVPLVDTDTVLGFLFRGFLGQGSLQGQSGRRPCPEEVWTKALVVTNAGEDCSGCVGCVKVALGLPRLASGGGAEPSK